jgi:antitoxin component of MazEF toxin-antitoxin module
MTLLCRTAFSQVGNSQAVIIPKKFMESLKIPVKSNVELYETQDGIFIKPVREWSAKIQNQVIEEIIELVGSSKDNEPLPENFVDVYCNDQNNDNIDWDKVRLD